jgi:hypothetical protein
MVGKRLAVLVKEVGLEVSLARREDGLLIVVEAIQSIVTFGLGVETESSFMPKVVCCLRPSLGSWNL